MAITPAYANARADFNIQMGSYWERSRQMDEEARR